MPLIRARPQASNDDSIMPAERLKKVTDILDWIASVFGFQVMYSFLLPLLFPNLTLIVNCPGYKCW